MVCRKQVLYQRCKAMDGQQKVKIVQLVEKIGDGHKKMETKGLEPLASR